MNMCQLYSQFHVVFSRRSQRRLGMLHGSWLFTAQSSSLDRDPIFDGQDFFDSQEHGNAPVSNAASFACRQLCASQGLCRFLHRKSQRPSTPSHPRRFLRSLNWQSYRCPTFHARAEQAAIGGRN